MKLTISDDIQQHIRNIKKSKRKKKVDRDV